MRTPLRIGAAALVLLTGIACGSDDDAGSSGSTGSSGSNSASGAGGTKKVTITGTEALQFDPATFTATKDEKISLTLKITGAIPHNIKIEKFGVKDSETLVSKADESKTVDFTASEAGSFEYVCTIHPAMKGTLTVA